MTTNKELSFSVKYQNKGNVDVNKALFNMRLYASSAYSKLHYKDLKIECHTTGGAECPLAYRKSPNESYESTGVFSVSQYGIIKIFDTNEPAGNEVIPRMPAGSTVEIVVKFTPTKYVSNIYDSCGTNHTDIIMSWNTTEIRHTDTSYRETDDTNNAISKGDMESIKTSDLSNINLGRIQQK